MGKELVLEVFKILDIPEDLLTDEIYTYILNTFIIYTEFPEELPILSTIEFKENKLFEHLNKYTIITSCIFLFFLFLLLVKFNTSIKRMIRKSDEIFTILPPYNNPHYLNQKFKISIFISIFTVVILGFFQWMFYNFSKKFKPPGSLNTNNLDTEKYGNGKEELTYLIFNHLKDKNYKSNK